jgi:hypothetical protein
MDRRFDEVMNKLSQMTKVMVAQKNPEASQPAADAMRWEAEVEARKQ